MALHMTGKESDNNFTPITNLSKVAPSARTINPTDVTETDDDETRSKARIALRNLEDHPAYGFKAGLIRIIGNMVHKNKMCQDLVRAITLIFC